MNIQYIKSNISNISQDSLVKLLYDIILQDIKNIEDYILGNIYKKGNRVYLQENGKHQIYQCVVDTSSNKFIKDEWQYIMEVFDGSIEKVYNLKLQEEVHIISEDTRNSIITNLNFDESKSTVAIYKGKKRYCIKYDFSINDKEIVFKNPFNIGDRLILEVREKLGIPVSLSVVFYDLSGVPYSVAISNNGILSVQKIHNVNPTDIKYTELVTGEHTYTMMVDSGVNPPTLGLYKDIETYITGTDDKVYKVDIIDDVLNLDIIEDVGNVYSDTKIIMGSDKRFYTLSKVNNKIIATEVINESLDCKNFEIGVKTISNDFKNRMIDINNGIISVKPYINNGGFHNILLKSKDTSNVIRLSINEDLSLVMYEGYETEHNRTSSQLLDYFYFFDNDWNYHRLFIDKGELIYEPCEGSVIPDSRGINILTPSGEIAKITLPSIDDDLTINKVINLSNSGTFESPIEGFVMLINNNKKLVTINSETNGFDIVDTNERFRTNHHYIMSEDNKIYKLNVNDNNVTFIEQNIDEFDVECINIGTFIKSNEMITKFEIKNGELTFRPISTFVHRIKSDDGKSYIMDIEGVKYNEVITFREIQDDSFSGSVGTGELYLEDNDGIHYRANISDIGNLYFTELDKELDIDYEVTSLVYSSNGWYKLSLDNYNLKITKIFDNMYENKMAYGNIVKKDYILTSEDGVDYSLYANGNGELNIKESKPVNVKGLVLRSDNGYTYGLGVLNDTLVSYESYVSNPRVPDKLYITDTVTKNKHVLFMSNNRLCSEIVSITQQSEDSYIIYDTYQTEYILEMQNNNLVVSRNFENEFEEQISLVDKFVRTARIDNNNENIKVSIGGVDGIPYKEEKIDISNNKDIDDILLNLINNTKNEKGD